MDDSRRSDDLALFEQQWDTLSITPGVSAALKSAARRGDAEAAVIVAATNMYLESLRAGDSPLGCLICDAVVVVPPPEIVVVFPTDGVVSDGTISCLCKACTFAFPSREDAKREVILAHLRTVMCGTGRA